MGISFFWDDYSEIYDDNCIMEKCSLVPESVFLESVSAEQKNSRKNIKTVSGEQKNILISGDNYPVLQLLVKENEVLEGGVDLIYIDPPYNTGKEFTYNDNFSRMHDKHSAWLSFMNRRLKIAQKLLKDSGCIFIAIDQAELYTLKLLCDQIFGEENFVNDFMWLHGKGKKDSWSRTLQQHTLCYAKNKKSLKPFSDFEVTSWAKSNVDNDERGNWFSGSISFSEERSSPKHKNFYEVKSPSGVVWKRQWMLEKPEMEKLIADRRIYFGPAPEYNGVPRVKIFDGERSEVIPKNIIDCVESTRAAQKHVDELLGEKGLFDNPKPVDLIEHLIEITRMSKDSVILDFFAGSGTTYEAVCSLNKKDGGNRHCILVQKPEVSGKNEKLRIDEICKRRCQKVSELYGVEIEFWKLAEEIKGK